MERKRNIHTYLTLIRDLRGEPDDWRDYLKMDEMAYSELLRMVTPLIKRKDTVMRRAISPHERLACTLRFLATGKTYRDLRSTEAISHQALSRIIPDTCRAICKVLHKEYMKAPQSQEEWKQIAREFEQKWNLPHCLGAVDGKHVKITPPKQSDYFFNYKGFHSMVLVAVVNANYEFIISEFGVNGRISDGSVIDHTTFYNMLKNKTLEIPEPERIGDSDKILNYAFVGNEAFALTPNFLKPFSQKELTNEHKIFNYRISRANRIVENAFGILADRFRIFNTSINLKLENIDVVVMTCCALHNFLRRKFASVYTPIGSLDFENNEQSTLSLGLRTDDSNLSDIERGPCIGISEDAEQTREQFSHYFNNEGNVPWQNRMCNMNSS